MKTQNSFFHAKIIASALKCVTRTIHRRAARKAWPRQSNGYIVLYKPPQNLIEKCRAIAQRTQTSGLREFSIGIERRAEISRALHRLDALSSLETELFAGIPFEAALARVATHFRSNKKSLRDWADGYSKHGFAALLESKRGRVGRKPKAKK